MTVPLRGNPDVPTLSHGIGGNGWALAPIDPS